MPTVAKHMAKLLDQPRENTKVSKTDGLHSEIIV